jgi:tRNA threonylcarbamoyladenosine biosynthesis protein TsaB
MSIVLGLDTSTTACSVAVVMDGSVKSARFEEMMRGQAERLNPMIAEVMAEAGVSFGMLSLIAVTVGPGAFTGLRIGLACARAMGLATGVPLAGITTFDALAVAVPADERAGREMIICVNGKRRDAFVQRFDASLAPVGEPGALAPDHAPRAFGGQRLLVAGDGVDLLRPAFSGHGLDEKGDVGEGVDARIRFSSAVRPPDARHVAAIGALRGPSVSPPRPFYIRPPDAQMPGLPGRQQGPS